ncbi:MAG: nucleotidyltransferase [Oscillospiraceae bacterium]|nr:nucleotidyltransferase [Oscillospiraceae bacterium]
MDAALVIMAAGLGTRFGEGIKQLTPVGRHGEIIMDYSIHDAVEAGFNKIVFVIRRDIKDAFYAAIGSRIEGICRGLGVKVECAFQELSELPEGFECPEGRTKPWGTGQAVLAAAGVVDCPFAVINADDYYGKEGFRLLYKSITSPAETGPMTLYMSGYRLGNTLSETGGVTRGVCVTDEDGWLCDIKETSHIVRRGDAADADGVTLPLDAPVSMNMWGLPREFMDLLREGFVDFLKENGRELKTEFLLPIYIGALLKEGKARVKVLPTGEKWFGMTYKEDTEAVRRAFAAFEDTGVYKAELFSDL